MKSKTKRSTWRALLALAAFTGAWVGTLEHSLHLFENSDAGRLEEPAIYCVGCDSGEHPHPGRNSHDERACRVCTARTLLVALLERGVLPEPRATEPFPCPDVVPDPSETLQLPRSRGPPRI